jgi:hypothetical protein
MFNMVSAKCVRDDASLLRDRGGADGKGRPSIGGVAGTFTRLEVKQHCSIAAGCSRAAPIGKPRSAHNAASQPSIARSSGMLEALPPLPSASRALSAGVRNQWGSGISLIPSARYFGRESDFWAM